MIVLRRIVERARLSGKLEANSIMEVVEDDENN
jgi:hypothetical protein